MYVFTSRQILPYKSTPSLGMVNQKPPLFLTAASSETTFFFQAVGGGIISKKN
jgi:hypothetical protein